MKFTAFLILSCACICIVHSLSMSWGNLNGRVLGTQNITMSSTPNQMKNVTFSYPPSKSFSPKNATIWGIKMYDYKSHPSKVTFLSGSIGSQNVTIQVQSQRGHGIKAVFVFYG